MITKEKKVILTSEEIGSGCIFEIFINKFSRGEDGLTVQSDETLRGHVIEAGQTLMFQICLNPPCVVVILIPHNDIHHLVRFFDGIWYILIGLRLIKKSEFLLNKFKN